MVPVYLDFNATTPVDKRVVEVMLPYLHTNFGNPSSNHFFGLRARQAVDKARSQVSQMLNCKEKEVVFTSGGSESNNFAIKGLAFANRMRGNHIITSQVEHPAVTEVCRHLQNHGYTITFLPVDEFGRVDPCKVEHAISQYTTLISIMHANNEVGTLMAIREIADIAHRHGIPVHSDCAQSVGKVPVTTDSLKVDMLSIAGHKLYAPKGIGVLYVRDGLCLDKLIDGANHEMGLRAGTENVLQIAGLGEACSMISENLARYSEHMEKVRNYFEKNLFARFGELRLNGHPEERLPNTSSVSFKNINAQELLDNMPDIAASPGAACHSDGLLISSVPKAMNVPGEYAEGTIRFSFGRGTTIDEIDFALEKIGDALKELKQ